MYHAHTHVLPEAHPTSLILTHAHAVLAPRTQGTVHFESNVLLSYTHSHTYRNKTHLADLIYST